MLAWLRKLFTSSEDIDTATPLVNPVEVPEEELETPEKVDVVISYAHSPGRRGAHYNGVYEHELSVEWSDELSNVLKNHGCKVTFAPIGGLKDKVTYVNNTKPVLAIEIHFNASINEQVNGIETLYCAGSNRGLRLATLVHKHCSLVTNNRDRGVKVGWYRMDRPSIVDYDGDIYGDETLNYFLAKTQCPAIIIEPEFISQLQNIKEIQHLAVEGIATGIKKYLGV